jgi:hypothetical protein
MCLAIAGVLSLVWIIDELDLSSRKTVKWPKPLQKACARFRLVKPSNSLICPKKNKGGENKINVRKRSL